jgi:VWFA-related protein
MSDKCASHISMTRSLALGLFAAGCWAQQPLQDPSSERTFKVDTRIVAVPVTVTAKNGKTVNGLQMSDFRVYDNGRPVEDLTLDVAFHPVSIVIAVQANGDVEGMLPKIQKIGPLLESLVGEAGEAALVAFDHRIRTLQEFTNDTGKITEAIKKIKPGSSSSMLNDTVMEAINMLKNKPRERRKIILLFSETRDRGSGTRVREVLLEAQFHDIVVYSVDISRMLAAWTKTSTTPQRPDPVPAAAGHTAGGGALTPTTQLQNGGYGNAIPGFVEIFKQVKGVFVDNPVEAYTKWSGGREYSFASQATLERAVADMGEEIRSQYLLTYRAPQTGGYHEIRVDVLGLGTDLHVRAKKGFYVAGPAPEEEETRKSKRQK